MNAITQSTLPALGTPMPGGFFAGAIMIDGQRHALIVAPKKFGDLEAPWHPDEIDVPGAKSYFEGLANTKAMAEAGSEIAKQVLALEIDGLTDYFIPAQNQMELAYRAFKPTTQENWCYARSGINLSAEVPTYPYTPEFPIQTPLEAFKDGADEAFETEGYWTSTQHAGSSNCAWYQLFDGGHQNRSYKDRKLRVRAVRSEPI
jgi:hypothetical protein